MTEPAKKDLRPLAASLCAAAAACLLFAAFSHTWLSNANRYGESGMGLRSNYDCATSWVGEDRLSSETRQQCVWLSNQQLVAKWRELGVNAARFTSSAFVPAGWITFIVALLAALGLVTAAVLGALKRPVTWPMAPTTIALLGVMIGLISGCVFVATKPGPAGTVGVGLSFWIFGVGCVVGIAGAQLMAKVNRPPDPDLIDEWSEV